MVDFLDRDDQEMILFTEKLLKRAARHKIHIQLHGCSKFSGEQRTFPHLLNREGVLNLEYSKWNDWCTPQHNVMVAYTRALAGPVDYHHGGFRSAPRRQFKPRDHNPFVMGTRCHHMALYVVYENPMPMVADTPSVYRDQPGLEFIRTVPTTWDETRFLQGVPGEYFCIARRKNGVWYLGGINDWQKRTIELPASFLGKDSKWKADLYLDVPDVNNPNRVLRQNARYSNTRLRCPSQWHLEEGSLQSSLACRRRHPTLTSSGNQARHLRNSWLAERRRGVRQVTTPLLRRPFPPRHTSSDCT